MEPSTTPTRPSGMNTRRLLASAAGLVAVLAWTPGAAAVPLDDEHAPRSLVRIPLVHDRPADMPLVLPSRPPVPMPGWRTDHLPRPVPMPELASGLRVGPPRTLGPCRDSLVGSPRLRVSCVPGPVPDVAVPRLR